MTSKAGIVVLFALLFLPRPGQGQTPNQPTLSPGDSIQIAVYGNLELSGRYAVRPDGTVGDPFYSAVRVAGVPLPEVERQIRDHVARYEQNPMLIVDPFFLVSVGGEVRQPGVYGLGVGSTVTQAVLRAGGINERGAANRVILFRDGREMNLDLRQPGATMGGMQIRSGDQLVIRPRRQIFRNYVVPVATITGAVAAIMNAIDRQRR